MENGGCPAFALSGKLNKNKLFGTAQSQLKLTEAKERNRKNTGPRQQKRCQKKQEN
jgi:hypothetical protein